MQDAKSILLQGGLTRVTDIIYPAQTTDFTPFAQKVVASDADVFVPGLVALPESVAFIKYFKQQHYNPRAFIAASGPDQGSSFINAIGDIQTAEGIFVPNDGWYPGAATFQNDQFTKDYIARYGGTANDISSDTVQAYSTLQVLAQAITKIHSFDNARLTAELHKDTFTCLQGPEQFASEGENKAGIAYLFQWQKGELIPVFPSTSAQSNPEYPKLNWPWRGSDAQRPRPLSPGGRAAPPCKERMRLCGRYAMRTSHTTSSINERRRREQALVLAIGHA